MDKHKLILPVSILLGCLVLGGFFFATQIIKQGSIERQQAIKLQEDRRIEEAKAEQAKIEVDQVKAEQDPAIKIEKCKAQATSNANALSNQDYHKASDDYAAKGDYRTAAQMLLNKPTDNAAYSFYYNSEYIKCLDN